MNTMITDEVALDEVTLLRDFCNTVPGLSPSTEVTDDGERVHVDLWAHEYAIGTDGRRVYFNAMTHGRRLLWEDINSKGAGRATDKSRVSIYEPNCQCEGDNNDGDVECRCIPRAVACINEGIWTWGKGKRIGALHLPDLCWYHVAHPKEVEDGPCRGSIIVGEPHVLQVIEESRA